MATPPSLHLNCYQQQYDMNVKAINIDEHQQTPNNAPSTRGRKPGVKSSGAKKKQPQRGMGVAQLERLRREEFLKKIAAEGSSSSSSSNVASAIPFNHVPFDQQFLDVGSRDGVRVNTVPLGCNGGAGVSVVNGGFCNARPVLMSPYVVSGPGTRVHQELSSMPKMFMQQQQQYHHDPTPVSDYVCFKKKRFDIGENAGIGYDNSNVGIRRNQVRIPEVPNTGVCYGHINRYNSIHRKNNNVGANGRVLMEYEFFPQKDSSSSSEGSGSCVTKTTTVNEGQSGSSGSDGPSFVDLSLKLSCV